MAYKGIDYGLGTTNIDTETGIRYGVINQNRVLSAWAELSEPEYGPVFCPKCGNEAELAIVGFVNEDGEDADWFDDSKECHCGDCEYSFDQDDIPDREPLCWVVEDDDYTAECDEHGDIFVIKSPYYTRAAFCSPCAPGACYLASPMEDGERAYCFDASWFDNGDCPYDVYSVETGKLISKANQA